MTLVGGPPCDLIIALGDATIQIWEAKCGGDGGILGHRKFLSVCYSFPQNEIECFIKLGSENRKNR